MASVLSASAEVAFLRMEQSRIWLSADKEPLPQLLERFASAGVAVEMDPSVQKAVSGQWRDADLEDVLERILTPYNYLLDWRQVESPLGLRTQLTGIQVFGDDRSAAGPRLQPTRRIQTSPDGRFRFLAREILIGFGPGASIDDLRSFLARTGGTVIATSPELGVYRILLPEGANILEIVKQLANDPKIVQAEPNYIFELPRLMPGDSVAEAVSSWSAPSGDGTVAVSVLDSGLLPSDSLNAAVLSAFDATNPDIPLVADAVGHGTKMAELAAGLVDPYGRAVGEGVPVLAVKAFLDDGTADSFTLMNAMTYAVQNSDGPVSLSWGTPTPSKFIENAVGYAVEKGSPVFAAVGNEPTGDPMYPAAYPQVIGVAASDGNRLADYSNRGDFVDLIAPGSAGGSQGTSVATAYVAHVAGLYMRHHPGVTAQEAVTALRDAAGDDRFLSEEAVRKLLVK